LFSFSDEGGVQVFEFVGGVQGLALMERLDGRFFERMKGRFSARMNLVEVFEASASGLEAA